jgi:hypothetical protein
VAFLNKSNGIVVIVLAELQAVNTGRRGKPLGQNVYGTGRTTGWKKSRDKVAQWLRWLAESELPGLPGLPN